MNKDEIKAIEKIVNGYIKGVQSGRILACRYVRMAITRHVNDLKRKDSGLYFDRNKAAAACSFFPLLTLWKGKEYQGLPFELSPHMTFITWVLMGWYQADGTRRFRKAHIEMARKGSKTTFAAGLASYFLIADGEEGAEVYSAAALALDTQVPTIDGWSTVKEIKVGDTLFDDSGNQCKVTYVTEEMINHECYRMEFDGAFPIIADAGHLWETIDRRSGDGNTGSRKIPTLRCESGRKAVFCLHNKKHYVCKWSDPERDNKFKVMLEDELIKAPIKNYRAQKNIRTTKDILESLYVPEYWNHGPKGSNHKIEIAKAIKTPEVQLPIPPYILGVWLGDGRSNGGQIVCHSSDIEIIDHIKSHGFNVTIMPYDKELTRFTITGLRTLLRENNLLDNKHIPKEYMRSSIQQRIELLKGLMDTDGTILKTGECCFSNVNRLIAYGVYELALSLGIKAHITKKPPSKLSLKDGYKRQPFYHVSFRAYSGNPVFNMERKYNRQIVRPNQELQNDFHYIKNVVPIHSVPVKCIEVDSPSHLFLVGKEFIPTHNTTREQARLVWTNIQNLTKKSIFAKSITYFKHNLSIQSTNSKCEPLSSDAKSLDGLDTHFASLDELHAHPTREVHDLLADSIGARSQPMILIITTAGFNQTGICYETRDYLTQILKGTIQDDSFFGIIYTLDTKKDWPDLKERKEDLHEGQQHEDDWTNEDVWVKAAPGLIGITESGKRFGIDKAGIPIAGYMTKIEDMRDKARIAKQMPSAQNNFLTKRLNIWCQQENRWIDLALWDQNSIQPVTEKLCMGRRSWGGIDLSSVSDLTVWVQLFPDDDDPDLIDVLVRTWCPEARLYDTKNKYREQYQAWHKQGYLWITEGDAIDEDVIRNYIVSDKQKFNIQRIGIDRGFQGYTFARKLDEEMGGTEKDPIVAAVGMGWVSMMGPCQRLEQLLLMRKLNHGANPILRWCADSVSVKINPTGGGMSPNKATSQGKIDGIIGILLGLDGLMRGGGPTPSAYANLTPEQITARMVFK